MAARMTAANWTRDDVLAAVRAVMSRVFGIPPDMIDETTHRADIERWDSLNAILISIGLERRLGRPVDAAVCTSASTVEALIDALCASTEPIE
jgi:acyl carrier protein